MYRLGCISGLVAPLQNDRLAGAWHCHIAMADDLMADLRFQTLTAVIKSLVKQMRTTKTKDNDKKRVQQIKKRVTNKNIKMTCHLVFSLLSTTV